MQQNKNDIPVTALSFVMALAVVIANAAGLIS